MENIADVLENNQLLVFSIVLLLLCAVAARGSSWLSTRRIMMSEKTRREHEAVIQIAAFRQKWIDDLRDTLSKFQSIGVHPDTNAVNEKEFYELGTKIELLMNPTDNDYERLQRLMYSFLEKQQGDTLGKYAINPEFVTVSQRILKREWDRLKEELRDPIKFIGNRAKI